MRNTIRNALILVSIFLAISIPFISSGYSELEMAGNATSSLGAAEHYQAAAVRLPWKPELYDLAGHHYYLAKEYTLADAMYKKAFKRKAVSPDSWSDWGIAVSLNGDTERAVQIWEQGLEQPNPSEKLYFHLANIFQQNREYANAAEYLRRYVDVYTDDASARHRLGLLLTLSDPNEAVSQLLYASQLDPQFDSDAQILRTALNLSSLSDSPSAQYVLIGRGLGLVNQWELAQAAFDQAVKLDENNAEALAWLGLVNQQTAGGEALVYLDRALSLDPNSSVVYGLRGLYFQQAGNHREALISFQSAAKLDPQNPSLYVSIGEEFSKLGDLILALDAYKYAANLVPDDARYWRLLAGLCAQNNVNVSDVGVPAAQIAVTLTPNDPLALDLLGWLLVLDGRYFEAEQILLRALDNDPQMASAHFHLALLYLQLDDRDAMYTHLIQARNLGSADAGVLLQQYFP